MAEQNQDQKKDFKKFPRTIKITQISPYNEKLSLISYVIYGHNIIFQGLFKTDRLTQEIREYDVNPDTVYLMFSDGPFINYLAKSNRF